MNVEIKEAKFETRKQFGFLVLEEIIRLGRKMGYEIGEIEEGRTSGGFKCLRTTLKKQFGKRIKTIDIELYKWSWDNTLNLLVQYHHEQSKRLTKLLRILDKVLSEYPIDDIDIDDDCVTLDFFKIDYSEMSTIIRKIRRYTNEVKLEGWIVF